MEPIKQMAAEAVTTALKNGQWQNCSLLADRVTEMGLEELQRQAEEAQGSRADVAADDEDWLYNSAYGWRLVVQGDVNHAVAHFIKKPTRAIISAFAKALGAPVSSVVVEERP